LEAVRDVEMRLDRDQFVVTVDTTKASEEELVAIVKKAGYTANVVTGDVAPRNEVGKTVGSDAPIFVKALARARKENKPVVVDFYAGWCGPCLKMLEVTFPDPKVAALLERCVFLKVDTDEYPELAKGFGVVGLPDIRLLAPDGTEKRRLLDFQDAESFGAELEKLLASADG
ncbi:MAG: thioredoxin domain-containing protein, partial [Rhodothermia bacterium]